MRRAHGRENFARTISNVSLTATSGRARFFERRAHERCKKKRKEKKKEEHRRAKKGVNGKGGKRNCWTPV